MAVTGFPLWNAEFVIDGHTFVSQSGSNGIHIAGDAGGVYFVSGGVSLCGGHGVIVDEAYRAVSNREIFSYTGFAVDSDTLDGYHFGVNSCSTFNGTGGWANGNHNCGIFIDPTQSANSQWILTGFIASDNFSNGLYAADGQVFATGCQFSRNGHNYGEQWGVVFGSSANARAGLVGCQVSENGLQA